VVLEFSVKPGLGCRNSLLWQLNQE